jgi:primosomal protein N' (replication factor Y)
VGLVLILNCDAALYTQDFRAPERLFSQIAQVSGRAGRTNLGTQAKILIVSQFPQDTVYQYAQQLDVEGFLNHLLEERQALGLPPTCYQALIHAEHKSYDRAAELLQEAAREAQQQRTWPRDLTLGDVVPRVMMKIAGKERAQLLLEAKSRPAMQQALNILESCLQNQSNHKKGVAYYIDRDPLHI